MNLIKTRFNAQSTADEVVQSVDLRGVRAIVTGAGSGIGVETARSLARVGAEVTLAVRNPEAGHAVAHDIVRSTGNPAITVAHLDLADRSTIAGFVAAWQGPLHLLINNAGIMACPLQRTPEGWEMQFATNHFGHFALAVGLHAALAEGARQRGGARIVSVSSSAHVGAPVDFDDIHFAQRPYEPWAAYAQSKTANILFAVEATRRWADAGIVCNALHPGGIRTGLQKHVPARQQESWKQMEQCGTLVWKTPEQGAATTMVAAVSSEFAQTGGHYLVDCNEAPTLANDAKAEMGAPLVRAWALDPEAARRLWDVSEGAVC